MLEKEAKQILIKAAREYLEYSGVGPMPLHARERPKIYEAIKTLSPKQRL